MRPLGTVGCQWTWPFRRGCSSSGAERFGLKGGEGALSRSCSFRKLIEPTCGQ